MLGRIEMEIIAGQLGNMDESLNVNCIQADEQPKGYNGTDNSVKAFTDLVLHVIALEPGLDVSGSIISPALRLRAVDAQLMPVAWRIYFFIQYCLDGAVHQQIRIAPDRRSEVRVGFVRQSEMAHIIGAVDCLAQRTQHDCLQ